MNKDKKKRSGMRVSDKNTMKIIKNPKAEQILPENSPKHSNALMKKEDRILWETVARTTRPLHPVKPQRSSIIEDLHLWDIENGINIPERVKSEPTKAGILPSTVEITVQAQQKPMPAKNLLHDIDRPTIRKIAKGRLEIQARIDLHGMRQREAHDLLYGFLADAWHRGLRFVLVITGKGSSSGSEGILKQAVPHWFSTPLFRIYVSAYEDAVRHHGGQGALYVRLRKTPAEKRAEGEVLFGKRRSL